MNARRRSRRHRREPDEAAMQFTPAGLEMLGELMTDLELTEPGRAALAMGYGIGSAHEPCRLHDEVGCEQCDRVISSYLRSHIEQLYPDGIDE